MRIEMMNGLVAQFDPERQGGTDKKTGRKVRFFLRVSCKFNHQPVPR